jgi:hypothetical protein
MLRILRGLDSRALPCGCLVGVYETYAAATVAIIDAKGIKCAERKHRVDSEIEFQTAEVAAGTYPPSTIPTRNR